MKQRRRGRSRRGSRGRYRLPIGLGLAAAAIFALGYGLGTFRTHRPAKPPAMAVTDPTPLQQRPSASETVEEPRSLAGVERGPAETVGTNWDARLEGRVAIVIDDLGRSVGDVTRLSRLGIPLTFAVLPYEVRTDEVVASLRELGGEVLCHLPMEPGNGKNPGPGALTSAMGDRELAEATQRALARVPIAVGVNNHMGSRMTTRRGPMRAVSEVLAAKDLYLLDSRTSAESVFYKTALSLGIPAAERQVFLDTDPDPQAIEAQVERLFALAKETGAAIAIGHPYPSTMELLEAIVPEARRRGLEFVPVSFLLDRAPAPEG